MQKITFTDTEVVKAPYVEINGVEYEIESEYEGGTDLNASTFNTMQNNIETAINAKQDTLVSGTNIKTINGNSLLGSGNINLNTIISSAISIQTGSIELSAFGANEARWNLTEDVTIPSGYTAFGVIGYGLSGGGFTNLFINELWFDVASNKLHYTICNNTSNITATITLSYYILIVKNQ